jgi:hypothetical protein
VPFPPRTTRSTLVSFCNGIFFPARALICQLKVDKLQVHSDEVPPALKEGASEMFSIVKGQIGNFIQSSTELMRALDEVGKLHPFIMSMWNNQLSRQRCLT